MHDITILGILVAFTSILSILFNYKTEMNSIQTRKNKLKIKDPELIVAVAKKRKS